MILGKLGMVTTADEECHELVNNSVTVTQRNGRLHQQLPGASC